MAASIFVVATSSAELDVCSPRDWAISLVDPNVLDADSYEADISLLIDHAGRPRIFYARGPVNGDGWRIKSAIERPGEWHTQRLPADPGSPRPSVARDRLDRYHLAWRTGEFFGQGILHYALIDKGTWSEEIVDDVEGGTSDASIAVDTKGIPHIVYAPELAGLPMRYAKWNGTAWEKEDIVIRGGILSPSLVLDAADKPHLAYIVDSGGEVDYALRIGASWTVEIIDVVSPNQTLATSLALDSKGHPHVTYDEFYAVGVNYAVKSESGWSIELIDAGQRWDPALVLDQNDKPHTVFYDADRGALIYATRVSGAWCVQTVEDDPNELIRIGRNPAIALDESGAINIAYHYHDAFGICQVKHAVSQE